MKSIFNVFIVLVVLVGGFYLFAMKQEPAPVVENNPEENLPQMSFFITGTNPGKGGDLGGLAGADAYCTTLAESVGVTGKTWKAYLSTVAADATPAVNAKDRIGSGPWYNASGVMVASSVEVLHGENNLNKLTALTEKGEVVSGRGDTINVHDILTGSNMDGTVKVVADTDTTCDNWTSGTTGSAWVGHHDRLGLDESAAMKSWNSSHASRGCSLEDLQSTGGGGLFYCFAQ